MKSKTVFWNVALRDKRGGVLRDKKSPFFAVPNLFCTYAADPFIIERDNKLYIFAELFPFLKFKGEIGYCIYENGSFSKWKTVIRDAHHLSYPYLFMYNGQVYMMPESGAASEIAFYKATDFPDRWEKTTISYRQNKMVDSILLPDGYILSYRMVKEKQNRLSLLKIDRNGQARLIAEKIDSCESLRPGGAAFFFNGQLIRPAQDCRARYGAALEFHALSSERDQIPCEECVGELMPEDVTVKGLRKKLKGLHTYNCTEHYEVIDVQYDKFSLLVFAKRLCRKLGLK